MNSRATELREARAVFPSGCRVTVGGGFRRWVVVSVYRMGHGPVLADLVVEATGVRAGGVEVSRLRPVG